MGVVISGITFTRRDINGNRFVEMWGIVEFNDLLSGYRPGGESFDFATSGGGMRRIERIMALPSSGALGGISVQPNYTDYPGPAGSGRITLATPLISGVGIQIASGTQLFLSGQLLSGNISGQVRASLFSGAIAGEVTTVYRELLSGVSVSGVRANVIILGY